MQSDHKRDRLEAQDWARGLFNSVDWVILDTETTGLGATAEVIQIGILSPDGTPLLDTLVKPRGRIDKGAQAVHGITHTMLADAPTYPDVHPSVALLLKGKRVVTYNAAFDRRLLRQTANIYGLELPGASWVCAMLEYSRFVGEAGANGYRTQKLPRQSKTALHGAIGDCHLTLECIRGMAHRREDVAQPERVPRTTVRDDSRSWSFERLRRLFQDRIG